QGVPRRAAQPEDRLRRGLRGRGERGELRVRRAGEQRPRRPDPRDGAREHRAGRQGTRRRNRRGDGHDRVHRDRREQALHVSRKGRRGLRGRRWLLALVLLAVVVVVAAVVVWLQQRPVTPPTPGPGPAPTTPPPEAQPASCPDVQTVAVPGTWESSPDDDPHDPTFNPNALLLNVTGPIQDEYGSGAGADEGGRVDVVTVPYVAQFARPFAPPEQTYDASRAAGAEATTKILSERYAECPLTSYVLMGFSQGAVIAGDVAAQIGQ